MGAVYVLGDDLIGGISAVTKGNNNSGQGSNKKKKGDAANYVVPYAGRTFLRTNKRPRYADAKERSLGA